MQFDAKPLKTESVRYRLCVLATTYPRDESDPCPPFIHELCTRLARDFAVTVIAPDATGARRGLWNGIQVVRYRYAPLRYQTLADGGGILPNLKQAPWLLIWLPTLLMGQAFALWRRRNEFHVIHAHWLVPQGLIAVTCGGGRPVLSTAHGADVFALRGRIWRLFRSFVIRRSAATSVVGESLLAEIKHVMPNRPPVVLPMGCNLAHFCPSPESVPVEGRLLFVGRFVAKKGVEQLLQAFALLIGDNPDLHLRLVGKGPEEEALRALANRLGLAAQVQFAGAIAHADLPAEYRKACVVVLPFRTAANGDAEGLGLTLIEALACGCTVVSGEVGAQQAALGALPGWYPVQSQPAALASGIRCATAKPFDPLLLRKAREDRLAAYDWSCVSSAYARLIWQLLPSPTRS